MPTERLRSYSRKRPYMTQKSTSPKPLQENARLAALADYGILDTVPEQAYDDLTTLAVSICRTPTAFVSFVDHDRVWLKSRVAFDRGEILREVSFCAHALLAPDAVFEIRDSLLDRRFASNPLVIDHPRIRFYAGASLLSPDGLAVGTICVVDQLPRALEQQEREGLASLARQVVAQLELRKAVRDRAIEASTDSLTGTLNRRAFDKQLKVAWYEHARLRRQMSLLLLDIDHFKSMNDEFGHAAGDATLVEVVNRIRTALRHDDVLSRHGGEEFTVVLPDTDLAGAQVVAEKIRLAVARGPWRYRPVTVSIGVASTHPSAATDPYAAVARVDQAMYLAKNSGRNCVRSVAA